MPGLIPTPAFFTAALLSLSLLSAAPNTIARTLHDVLYLSAPVATIAFADLPAEGQSTYRLIEAGGPFPYRRDGVMFQNREQRLPVQARGYYREYTIPTPGARDRGARRIIAGGDASKAEVFYYTADHYRQFKRIVK